MLQPPTLQQIKALIDGALNEFFASQKQKASQIDASYGRLWQELSDLGLRGGKRLRPYLTILSYMGFGGKKIETILPVAMATEVLHLSLLIHDDIIDRDQIRYGKPNLAAKYVEIYRQAAPISDNESHHYALSAALLAGDLGIRSSYSLVSESNLNSNVKLALINLFNQANFEVMGGELLDTEASFLPNQADKSFKIMEHKTASYSCILPLQAGALTAGAKPTDLNKLKVCGRHLGVAFQMRDDYLGIYGEEKKTGKPILSDLREGKKTHLINKALVMCSAAQGKTLNKLLGESVITKHDLEKVKDIIASSGALKAYEQKISAEHRKALKACQQTAIVKPAKEQFAELMQQLLHRDS